MRGLPLLRFTQDDKGCITYNLVYNASLSVSDAVAHAYKLGSKDKYLKSKSKYPPGDLKNTSQSLLLSYYRNTIRNL